MLVLSRACDEQLVLTDSVSGARVVITVCEFYRRRGSPAVRLGIEAPDSVRVDRAEIDAIRQAESKPRPLAAGTEDPP